MKKMSAKAARELARTAHRKQAIRDLRRGRITPQQAAEATTVRVRRFL